MHLHAKALWLPKRGHASSEYEDAFWPQHAFGDAAGFRCAIADGASETSFSREWARTLAKAYHHGQIDAGTFGADVKALQERWQSEMAARHREQPLAWYAEEKASYGAFSTLLGVTLHDDGLIGGGLLWEALAVGDSNLFVVRGDELIVAFPVQRASEFSRSPFLVSSANGTTGIELLDHVRSAHGRLALGDRMYLMTDALACWFLECLDHGQRPWRTLDQLDMSRAAVGPFASLMAAMRANEELQNDDVTLLRIHTMIAGSTCQVVSAVSAGEDDDGLAGSF